MRKWFIVLATLILVGSAVFFFIRWDKRRAESEQAIATPTNSSAVAANPSTADQASRPIFVQPGELVVSQPVSITTVTAASSSNVAVPAAVASSEPELLDPPPMTVLENMRSALRSYGSMFGGNPVGTNPEITRELNGGNPRHVKFVRDDSGLRINDRGELIDSWGTPFFFHQLSGKETEVHSAGPDRVMWTADDLVIR